MGKKLLLIGSQISLVAVLGYAICLFLPMHTVFWLVIGFKRNVDMVIYAMMVRYKWHLGSVCWVVKKLSGKKDLCDKDENGDSMATGVMLQDSSATWCAQGVRNIVHGACNAMSNAYIMGIMLLLVIIANFIMQGVGLWLIKEYMKKPKKQYREVAFFLDLIGGVLMLITVILYYPLTILQLDSMSTITGQGFSLSDSIGVSWGYIFLYFFIIIQAVSIILLANGSNSAEAREAELKEHKKFLQEQEHFQQAVEMTASSYGGKVGVSAPPNHWGQGVQESNWGAPQAGPQTNQAYPQYPGPNYGGSPMPSMQAMPPQMTSAPPMQQPGPGGPYF